jgi:hypothetical protein
MERDESAEKGGFFPFDMLDQELDRFAGVDDRERLGGQINGTVSNLCAENRLFG